MADGLGDIFVGLDDFRKFSADSFLQNANRLIGDVWTQHTIDNIPQMAGDIWTQHVTSQLPNLTSMLAPPAPPPPQTAPAAPPDPFASPVSPTTTPTLPTAPAPVPGADSGIPPPSTPPASVAGVPGPVTETTAGLSGGGQGTGNMTDRARGILAGAAQIASWLGDQGQKALQANLVTEGGLNNARGDNGKSAGPLQFYEEGQLANFAQQMGMTLDQAKTYVEEHPLEAIKFAIGTPDKPGYLGAAIQRGLQAGLQGADLATYAQRHGQVSVSPERAGQNFNALFGAGQELLGGAGQAVQSVASTVGEAVGGAGRVVSAAVNHVIDNLRPSQFGVGLSDGEAYAACGPVAAMAFARALGRNPTAQEAVELAKRVGWTPAQGMAGPASELDLLKSMGVPSHMEQGADPNKIAADVGNGNPVIISTPGHYFVVDGYDQNTGKFHAGTSGTDLKAGAEWMNLDQMQKVMGTAQATLFLDRDPNDGPSVASQMAQAPTGQTPTGQTFMGANQPAQPAQPASTPTPPQPPKSIWDQLGSGISDVFKNVFGGGSPSTPPTPPPPEGGGFGAVPPGGQNPLDQIGQGISNAASSVLGGLGQAAQRGQANLAARGVQLDQPGAPTLPETPILSQPRGLAGAGIQLDQPGSPVLPPTLPDLLDTAASNVPQQIPVVAGALRGIGALASAPTAPEAAQTASDIEQKYGGGLQPKPGGGVAFRAPDYSNITPEDQAALNNATFAVGGIVGGVGGPGPVRPPQGIDWAAANRADPANVAVGDMLRAKIPQTEDTGLYNRFVRAWTNRYEALDRYQADALNAAGLDPTMPPPSLDAAALRRLSSDPAAEVRLQQGLGPALQQVAEPEAKQALSTYLIHQNNIDVAKAIGERVEGSAVDAIPEANAAIRNAEAVLRGRQQYMDRLTADVNSSPEQIRAAQNAVNSAQRSVDRARANFDTIRQQKLTEASQTGAEAFANRSFSGGLKVADSQRALQSMEQALGPQGWQHLEDTAGQVYDFVGTLRKRMVDSGLIDAQTAAEWDQKYPHWVPTRILDYLDDPAAATRGAQSGKLSLANNGVRSYTEEGTTKFREDPLGSIVGLTNQVESLARKNEAANAVVELDKLRPEPQRLLRLTDDPATNKDLVIQRVVDGQVERYLAPKELAAAINGPQVTQAPGFVRAWTSFLRNVTTVLSPAFALVRNPSLDIPEYVTRELARSGGDPRALPAIAAELVRGYADAFQGYRPLGGGQFAGPGTQQFFLGGGGGSGMTTRTLEQRGQVVQDLSRAGGTEIQNFNDVAGFVKDLVTLKPIAAVSERTELGPRIASMRLAEQRGATPVRAVINGRSVTIDFNEGGTLAKTINSFVPFFNAGLQGSANTVRMFRENPGGAITSAAMTAGLPAVMAEAWNRSDPQRATDYNDVPQYLKDQGVVIMLPGEAPTDKQGNRKPQFWWVNMRGLAPFAIVAREAAEQVLSATGNGQAKPEDWGGLLSSIGWSASPIRASTVGDVPGTLMPQFVPGASTALQLVTNKDFFRGSDIATTRRDQNAPALAKFVANGLTTLARLQNPAAQVHPAQVDFAVRDVLGGVGSTILAVGDVATGTRPDDTPQTIPVVGGAARALGVRGDIGQSLQEARNAGLRPEAQRVLNDIGAPPLTPVGSTMPIQDSPTPLPLRSDEEALYERQYNQYVSDYLDRYGGQLRTIQDPAARQSTLRQIEDAARQRAQNDVLRTIKGSDVAQRVRQEYQRRRALGTPPTVAAP